LLQAWRCAPEDSGQVQLPSSPRGYHTFCKNGVHLNWPLTVLHLNRRYNTNPRGLVLGDLLFHFSLFTLHSSLSTLHSPLFTLHSSLFTLHSSLFTPSPTLYKTNTANMPSNFNKLFIDIHAKLMYNVFVRIFHIIK